MWSGCEYIKARHLQLLKSRGSDMDFQYEQGSQNPCSVLRWIMPTAGGLELDDL